MKHTTSHIAGFTLLEMVFSLGISGLVLVMGLGLWQTFQGYAVNWQDQLVSSLDFATLESQLQQDLREATEWEVQSSQIWLWQAEKVVHYKLERPHLIRETAWQKDSFAFAGHWQQVGTQQLAFTDTSAVYQRTFFLPDTRKAQQP